MSEIMLISDDLIFIELHKTGCTHIRNILKELLNGDLVGKHNQVSSNMLSEGKALIGSIRDPWEWYISLWAYGCDKKGSVFNAVTKNPKKKFRGLGSNPYDLVIRFISSNIRDPKKWKNTYRNVDDAEAFRTWLYMMHNEKNFMDIGGGYGKSSISQITGLLTFRYLKLFCTKDGDLKKLNCLVTFDQIENYEKTFCFIDHFIRNERLVDDLFRILEESSIEISSDKKSEIMLRKKTNTSSRKYGVAYYYDRESEKLIAEREKLIVDKFGYVIPSLRGNEGLPVEP